MILGGSFIETYLMPECADSITVIGKNALLDKVRDMLKKVQ